MPEPPRAEVALRPLARQDLADIYDYSRATFGDPTAERYITAFFEAFDALSTTPNLGVVCDDIRQGYRRLPVRKHVVFYRVEVERVEVIRILHRRMLPTGLREL